MNRNRRKHLLISAALVALLLLCALIPGAVACFTRTVTLTQTITIYTPTPSPATLTCASLYAVDADAYAVKPDTVPADAQEEQQS